MTTTCARCGAEVGDASYCPRCGSAVLSPQLPSEGPPAPEGRHLRSWETDWAPDQAPDWRTDTLERDEVPPTAAPPAEPRDAEPAPVVPAPAADPPGPVRYPLFADELDPEPDVSTPDVATRAPEPPPGDGFYPDDEAYDGDDDRTPSGAPPWLPWAIVAVVMALVAAGGIWLLLGPTDDDTATDASAPPSAPTSSAPEPSSSAPTPSVSEPTQETSEPSTATSSAVSGVPVGDPVDVAGSATATAPANAPPNTDAFGSRTTYVAANMLDGRAETCWRMAGDGTGAQLTFALAAPTTLTRVGMINGYAKNAVVGGRNLNWYIGNRRVLSAEWVFDDGTTVDQPLVATKKMQTIDLGKPVTTSTVTLRLVSVSSPGTGRSARNYTAISEVTLVGTPSG